VRIINFFGAPGAGKSTAALGLAHYLKLRWIHTEYVPEFAKDLVWRDSAHMLKHQLYVFAEQQLRIDCLKGKTEVVVSDSPLLLSSFYSPEDYPLTFKQSVFEFFDEYNNINFLIRRSHEYVAPGRIQDETQSDRLSVLMEQFLYETGIPFYIITASDANPRYLIWWMEKQGFIKSQNPAVLGKEYRPPADWEEPVLRQRLNENGHPKRSVAAIAKYYLDKDIPTVGPAPGERAAASLNPTELPSGRIEESAGGGLQTPPLSP
jgi:nicotinamide riboside kinase